MTRLPEGKSRLDLIREGGVDLAVKKRGRLIVALEKLKEDPKNERKTFRNMTGLIESIKAVGMVEPITVAPDANDCYLIITGHRRYRAAKAAGLKEVEVLIREPDDELTRRYKSLVSNIQREDIGPVELATALNDLMQEDSRVRSQVDLARMIGKDSAWVSGVLRILTLPASLQQKIANAKHNVGYDAIIRIARLDDAKQQGELVEEVVAGATKRHIEARIAGIKGKPIKTTTTAAAEIKPKRVFHTKHNATVIVQSQVNTLSPEQVTAALREATTISSA